MKTAKDQKINYLKYEKEHRKPAMSRLLTAACLLWMFITAAAEASSASQASLALQSAAAAGTAQTFTMNTFRYVVLFTIAVVLFTIATAVPYNDLFYIREQGKTVPVLSKYRFAPVDIRKMRRAKTFLLLRGTGFFYICSLIIYIATGLGYFGSGIPLQMLMPRFGFALLFSVCLTAVMLVSERIRFQLYASQAPSRT